MNDHRDGGGQVAGRVCDSVKNKKVCKQKTASRVLAKRAYILFIL